MRWRMIGWVPLTGWVSLWQRIWRRLIPPPQSESPGHSCTFTHCGFLETEARSLIHGNGTGGLLLAKTGSILYNLLKLDSRSRLISWWANGRGTTRNCKPLKSMEQDKALGLPRLLVDELTGLPYCDRTVASRSRLGVSMARSARRSRVRKTDPRLCICRCKTCMCEREQFFKDCLSRVAGNPLAERWVCCATVGIRRFYRSRSNATSFGCWTVPVVHYKQVLYGTYLHACCRALEPVSAPT